MQSSSFLSAYLVLQIEIPFTVYNTFSYDSFSRLCYMLEVVLMSALAVAVLETGMWVTAEGLRGLEKLSVTGPALALVQPSNDRKI